jgi:hypothetical protein
VDLINANWTVSSISFRWEHSLDAEGSSYLVQLYIFTKADVPMDVDFMITDTFEVRDLSGTVFRD